MRQLISRQLRTIIQDSGRTAYSLGREAGIDHRLIQRFINQERDIRLETLDRLAEVLGLRLVETGRGRSRSKPVRPPAKVNGGDPMQTTTDQGESLEPRND